MKMPRTPPNTDDVMSKHSSKEMLTSPYIKLATEFNSKYLHWDEVRLRTPKEMDPEALWALMSIMRHGDMEHICIGDIDLRYSVINSFQHSMHHIDIMSSAEFLSKRGIHIKTAKGYSVNASMEESIASSQVEGASTTRKTAKNMLRNGRRPRNPSERMILNNYNAMEFIKTRIDQELTVELILEIHRTITSGLLDDVSDEGTFRESDDIVVQDILTGDIFHRPPEASEIPRLMDDVCEYVNNEEEFIHPMIKAITIHFMLAYIHPFVDGNGRLARSLFYWFLLKKEYGIFEYLAISRSIKKHRGRYDLAYVYSETDGNDMTYFIKYNLDIIEDSLNAFMEYIDRKMDEQKAIEEMTMGGDLNMRQRTILSDAADGEAFSISEIESKYQISYGTAYADLNKLKDSGYIEVYGRSGNKLLFKTSRNISK